MPKGTIGGNVQNELGANVNTTIEISTGVLSINEDGQIVLHRARPAGTFASGSVVLPTWPTNYLLSFEANPRYSLVVRASGKITTLEGKVINHSGTTTLIGNL